MGMEFILFNLHTRDSSQVDPFVKRAQADFSWSSWTGLREGELELQAREASSQQGLSPRVGPMSKATAGLG